jgi:hypothetical protein
MHITVKRAFSILLIPALFFAVPALAQSAYTQSGGTATKTGETYSTTTADESAVKVTNAGTLTMTNCTVTKSGNSSSGDNSSFYGLNAGVLAYNATINITGGTVTTSGTGANGIFAYGSSGTATISGVKVVCTAQLGHAVMCAGGGTLHISNMDYSTAGKNSAPLATDRGGGTIIASGGTATSTGADSPGIYSTGTVTVSDATLSASNSEAAVIEGLNTVTLTNVNLTSGTNNYGGALIVQTMSGDSETGTSTFSMTGGSFTVPVNSLFFVTNNSANITLKGVTLNITSGILIKAGGTSRWGTSGSNGGKVTFTADSQTMSGTIIIDSLSTFAGTFKNSSAYTGAINTSNKAVTATLSMDATSTWTLTANSYLSSISNSAGISGSTVTNITGNGYNVYYNSSLSANSYLNAGTYSLVNGGYLLPTGSSAPTAVEDKTTLPAEWSLGQNYPNPFNPTTVITYKVPVSGHVALQVFDMLGREVETLVNDVMAAGTYTVTFNAGNLASGVYLYRISGNNFSLCRKMNLMK